jgi:hypothetical protein
LKNTCTTRSVSQQPLSPLLTAGQRDRAFTLGHYPCVGLWAFLEYRIPKILHDEKAFLQRLKEGETLLDLGCCFGQDLRHLALDSGASTESWYATDLRPELWEIGYDIFRDRDTMKAQLIVGDLLSEENALWKLNVKFGTILAIQILHVFSWEQNKFILRKIAANLTKPGTQIIGCQTAEVEAVEKTQPWGQMFFHDVKSFKKLWDEVGEETGTSWKVDARIVTVDEIGYQQNLVDYFGNSLRYILFIVTRE